jgi:heptosyltransferase-2
MKRLVILAPNWLGDAVMALPAIADIRRSNPGTALAVAARPAVAPLFRLVPGVDDIVTLARGWRPAASQLSAGRFDTAILLPNSFQSALAVRQAGIAERWGYRTDWRRPLLTRAVYPPSGLHQAEYYQQLAHALGFPNGPMAPTVNVDDATRRAAEQLLTTTGWNPRAPLVVLAPGAAYGGAKRWPPERFAALALDLMADGVHIAVVGSAADRPTTDGVVRMAGANAAARSAMHDLVGRTDLPTLAGVLAAARALVANDSGAMHLAAAVGTAVTAVFGPTNEWATRPVGEAHRVIAAPVWCRPCMLRECPLDHRCMRGVEVAPVVAAARRTL